MAKIVRIERGPNREGENLAGVHVLHHDRSVVGVRLLHYVVESLLGHELDVLVDGELQILAGLRLVGDGTKYAAARIHGGEHAPGNAVERAIEFAFEAAETVIVDADIPQDLRGDLVVGIKALELILEINALHIEGLEFWWQSPGVTRRAIQAKLLPSSRRCAIWSSRVSLSSGSVWTIGGQHAGCGFLVVDLRRNGIDGVDLHGHGEFVHVAVVENAAAGRNLKGALLLLLGALNVFVVADDLQPEEARGNGTRPRRERSRRQAKNAPASWAWRAWVTVAKTGCAESCLHV